MSVRRSLHSFLTGCCQEQIEKMLAVYKNEKIVNERVLGTYANHSTKIVFIKQFSKKCCLATGQKSHNTNKFLYSVGIDMSFEDLESLTDALGTISKSPNAVNYAEISETTDSQGNSYRLVLKRSEWCAGVQGVQACWCAS